jgi:hypothetical protein
MSSAVTIANPGRPLPTMEGKVSGIIAHDRPNATVQCSVCHRTATGKTFFAVKWADFANDDRDDWDHPKPALPYRRCEDCRSRKLHPQLSLDEATP